MADLHVPPNKIHWLSDVMELTRWHVGARVTSKSCTCTPRLRESALARWGDRRGRYGEREYSRVQPLLGNNLPTSFTLCPSVQTLKRGGALYGLPPHNSRNGAS